MNKTYITSDLHFCHNRDFLYGERGFKSIQEHNEFIVREWNKMIDSGDDVYILGDCMLNDDSTGLNLLRQLNGTLHIIRGNHDSNPRIKLYKSLWNVAEVRDGLFFKFNGQSIFMSHYPTLTSNHDEGKPLNRRVINLCGHAHTPDRWADWDKGLIYHCELDAHGCRPVLLDDILKEIKKRIDKNK